MDIGNLFKQLEEDSRVLLLSAVFCFPVAYLDCWKLSHHFPQIELISQIILAFGVGLLLVIAGLLFNMIFLLLIDHVEIGINAPMVLSPSFTISACAILFRWSILDFAFNLIGWSIISVLAAFAIRVICNKRKK